MKVILKTITYISLISALSLSAMEEKRSKIITESMDQTAKLWSETEASRSTAQKAEIWDTETSDSSLLKRLRFNTAKLMRTGAFRSSADIKPFDTILFSMQTEHADSLSNAKKIAGKMIEHAGIDLDTKDTLGRTFLMRAALYGNKNAVEFLASKELFLRLEDNEGNTAAMLAKKHGHKELAKYIEDNTVDID